MKTVNNLLNEYFVGKTLVKLEYTDEEDIAEIEEEEYGPTQKFKPNQKITSVEIEYDGEDPQLLITLENDQQVSAYVNEGIEIK